MKYFSKNIVDAVQYVGPNIQEVISFTGNIVKKHPIHSCLTGPNMMVIEIGDYVVKTESGLKIFAPNHFENKFTKLK